MPIEWHGQTYSISKLAKDFEVYKSTLARLLKKGLTVEEALERCLSNKKVRPLRGEKYEGKECAKHVGNRVRYRSSGNCIMCDWVSGHRAKQRKAIAAGNGSGEL